jgi:hypothetical protein
LKCSNEGRGRNPATDKQEKIPPQTSKKKSRHRQARKNPARDYLSLEKQIYETQLIPLKIDPVEKKYP